MIEKLIDWCTGNRFLVLVFYLAVTGYGIYSVMHLPVDAIPDLSENQVIIYTEWMGRSPELVEGQVTYPIVSALQGLSEVKAVRASTMFGMSFVFVIFDDNTDIYFARSRVAERMNNIAAQLPGGVVPQLGPDGTGVGHVFWYTVEGKYDAAYLRSIQDWMIRYKLSSVEGVAEVASIGGFIKQYQIDLDPDKLRASEVTIDEVIAAVRKNNNEVGGKLIESSGAEYFVRGQGYISSTDELENLPVKFNGSSRPVLVSDVATVQLGTDIRRGSLEKNGEGEVVGGVVVMRSGANASEVIEKVREKIKEISPGLPPSVEIKTAYDRSTLISQAIDTLKNALFESTITVSLMVIIFLLHVRSIIRILIEIPVSVLISFILMKTFGITSNIMSLGGIILAIGVIVDSSIVMVENAYRMIAEAQKEKGELSPQDYRELSILAAKQVGRAIFFSELIILVSFIPVFLLTGQEGKLFKPLAFTKTFVMFGSAIVAVTLIPVLMTFLMRGKFKTEEQNIVSRFFITIYRPVIHWVLKYKKTTLAINILALIITVPIFLSRGSEFMPPLDEGSLLFMPVTLPNASITEVNRVMQLQNRIIKSVPEVDLVLGKAGRAETATDNAPLSMIETIIILKPKEQWRQGITKQDIIAELDGKLQIPGVRNGWTQPIINRINMLSTGVRTDLGLKVFGSNLDTLEMLAIRAENILKQVDGAADVVAERNQSGYYLDIKPKKDMIARYNLDIADVQRIIETAVGGENISTLYSGRMRFPIRVRYLRDYRSDAEALKNLVVPLRSFQSSPANGVNTSYSQPGNEDQGSMSGMGTSTAGASVAGSEQMNSPGNGMQSGSTIYLPLSVFADVEVTSGPPMINSENGMMRSVVYLNARGRDMGSVMEDAMKRISNELKLPQGYTISWSGQYESKLRAQRSIMIIVPVVMLIIFLLLYFTLKDYKEAGVVMLSVPFALIGGVIAIYLLGYNLSVAVWVGLIALYGIAVETGVVMVVYLHEALDKRLLAHSRGLRGEITSKDIYEAAIEGSVLRLRPKLMTVATSIIGLVPIMWSTGTGADVMKPLTAPMIGGLITSSIHVLIVTPVIFVLMKENSLKKGKLEISKMADWMKEA